MTPGWSRAGARVYGNAYLLLTITALMWGGNAIASRMAIGEVSPMALTALRWIGVCLVMPWLFRHELAAHWPTIRANRLQVVAMGLIGFSSFNALMYMAAYSTTAINIGIIQGSIPIVVLLGAFLIFREPARPQQMLGVLVTMLGVAVTAIRGDLAVARTLTFATGDILMLAACVLYAGYTLALRRRPPLPPLVFFTTLAIVACISSLALLAAEAAAGAVIWPTWKGWALIAYVTVFPSLVSQLFFMRGVELIGPARAGIFVNLVPVFAAILAVVILGEAFQPYHGVAMALVLGGIWLAERR